jgi:hypothetical protein
MVKLSRKGVRKSKRNRSRKSGKSMVGGDYTGTGTYLRKKLLSTLYKLTAEINDNETVYTLDFSPAEGTALGMKRAMSQFDRYKDDMPNEYSKVLKEAMGVFSGSPDAEAIDNIIKNLFKGGIDAAKKRQLIIRQPTPTPITLSLIGDMEGEVTISKPDQFGGFLIGLGNDIKPI